MDLERDGFFTEPSDRAGEFCGEGDLDTASPFSLILTLIYCLFAVMSLFVSISTRMEFLMADRKQ